MAIIRRVPLREGLLRSVNKTSIGFFIGTMGYMSVQTYRGLFDEMSVDDRAYRIAHNQGQLEVDRLATQGAAAGLIYTALRGHYGVRSLTAYSLAGVGIAVYSFIGSKFLATPQGQEYVDRVKKEMAPLFNKQASN